MNFNPTFILNGDQIYLDELIRENARLMIQHEADLQVRGALEDELARLKAEYDALVQSKDKFDKGLSEAVDKRLADARRVIEQLMSGGDPCRVCAKTCKMGDACEPVWKGSAPV